MNDDKGQGNDQQNSETEKQHEVEHQSETTNNDSWVEKIRQWLRGAIA